MTPPKPKAPDVTPSLPMTWRCVCGDAVLNNYAYCAKCGRDRPMAKET